MQKKEEYTRRNKIRWDKGRGQNEKKKEKRFKGKELKTIDLIELKKN